MPLCYFILYLTKFLLKNTSTVLRRDDPPTTLHRVVTLSQVCEKCTQKIAAIGTQYRGNTLADDSGLPHA